MVKTITGYDRFSYETPYEMLLDFGFTAIGKDVHEILFLVGNLQDLGYSDLVNQPFGTICMNQLVVLTIHYKKYAIGCFVDKELESCLYSMICIPDFSSMQLMWEACLKRYGKINSTFIKDGIRISRNRILEKLYIEFYPKEFSADIQEKFFPVKWAC